MLEPSCFHCLLCALIDIACLRLHEEMMALTLKQNIVRIQADLDLMTTWCQQFREYGARQAGLDVKYVSERFYKGKGKVEDLMQNSHRLLSLPDYSQCQAEILKFSMMAPGTAAGNHPFCAQKMS